MPGADYMKITADVSCRIADSFRVAQVRGMFDLPLGCGSEEHFSVEVPDLEEDWQIGLIVGPSGSGKTTIARQAFGAAMPVTGRPVGQTGGMSVPQWPADRAVIDCLGDADIRQLTRVLAAVGFSSPPAWLRPYHVLSNGEKFRCDLARLLLNDCKSSISDCKNDCNSSISDFQSPLVVMDEFTSVVDRTVARLGSAALAGAIRGGAIARRFVAVSCHYDIVPWLCPDWVVDMATQSLARGKLPREDIRLDIRSCDKGLWAMFKRHHYLNGNLPACVRCHVGLVENEPVAFAAIAPVAGYRGYQRFSRVVVLPDYQGIGIGGKFRDAVAALEAPRCRRLSLMTSHPAMIRSLAHSARWRLRSVGFSHPDAAGLNAPADACRSRRVCSFVWINDYTKK